MKTIGVVGGGILTRALLDKIGEEEAAKRMMPLADEGSQQILAGSGLLQLMANDGSAEQHRNELHRNGRHNDVTGFYQRRKGKR